MKGIILAGGAGSRLYPMTNVFSKQLQPVYDKPMIYYPLSLLMLSGIRDILIISGPHHLHHFEELLGGGEQFGLRLEYAQQDGPRGLADAFIVGERYIKGHDVMMALGDNLFYGNFACFREAVVKQKEKADNHHAHIFAYQVRDPERYGVVEFSKKQGKILSIEEKPQRPKSNWAIPGLYLFDSTVSDRAKEVKPSSRGELEITDLIDSYRHENTLGLIPINRGMAWFDTGTPQSLLEASSFVGAIEQRQGLKVACLEEIALRAGYLNSQQFEKIVEGLPNCDYRNYLNKVFQELGEH